MTSFMTYKGFQIYHAEELSNLFELMKDKLLDDCAEPDKFIEFCHKYTCLIKPRDYDETLAERLDSDDESM